MDNTFDDSAAHLLKPTPGAVVEALRNYNAWRRGVAVDGQFLEMPHPKEIGIAIDQAVALIEARCDLSADFQSQAMKSEV